MLAEAATGNKQKVAAALLGDNWQAHLADTDAFAGIATMYSKASGELAEEVERAQLSGGLSSRLDAGMMLQDARAAAKTARPNTVVFAPKM